jgi:pyridoxal phosphate enzyme (YggS family)
VERVAKTTSKEPKETTLADRLKNVRERIAAAAAKSKRDPSAVTLVAVTKYAPPEQIREIIKLGVGDLGEARVQQLAQRAGQFGEFHQRLGTTDPTVAAKLRWHMIGHLQRNKIKALLPVVAMIQTIDSLRLAEELETQLERTDKKLPVLLQVNTSEEGQKSGVAVGAAIHLAEQIATMNHLKMTGIMAMAAIDADEKKARQTFSRTREIFEEMKRNKIGGAGLKHLSMGMTQDFEWAIEEGATIVRIGSALFGGKADHHVEEDKEE